LSSFDNISCNLANILEAKKPKRIVIFGAGRLGIETLSACKLLNYSPSFFIDNDPSKWERVLFGLKICSPQILLSEQKAEILILIATIYYGEISQQLDKMGFSKFIHYYNMFENDSEKERYYKEVNGVRVGRYTYGYQCICTPGAPIRSIGSFCSINDLARIGSKHPMDFISMHPFIYNEGFNGTERVPPVKGFKTVHYPYSNKMVTIGNDVWIGAYSVIMPGVNIGNGAVIGAGAIVTRDVPDYAIVVGAPARVIRYRFSQEQIEVLNRTNWWDWDDETLAKHSEYFTDINAFCEKFGS